MKDQRAGSQIDRLAIEAKTDPAIMPALWEAVERFIKWQSRQRFQLVGSLGGCEVDDLIQSGYIALVEAVQGFDPEKENASFLSLLALRLKTAFNEAAGIRSTRRDALLYAGSLDRPISEEEPEGEALIDLQGAPDAGFEATEDRIFTEDLHRALEMALDALPAKKREIIKARYYDGLTREEIARQRGCTGSAVREQERQALDQMRQQAKTTGLAQFVELHTLYYRHYGVEYMKRTHTSPVEAVFLDRERLRELWETEQRYTVRRYTVIQ